MNKTEDAALQRLLKIASSNTGQSRRVANFILAWWNATDHGGFDLAEIFAVDEAIADDMRAVFAYLSRSNSPVYPTEYRAQIEGIIHAWRTEDRA